MVFARRQHTASQPTSGVRRVIVALYLLGMCRLEATAADPPQPPPPPAPNVLLIVVDDLGWTDLGCSGSDFYDTPAIDRLAGEGMRFTQAYAAAPVCSPTRAALITGQFPARLHMTIWHEGAVAGGPRDRPLREAASRPNLPLETVTLAEYMQRQGYFTAHVGKWHLGTAAYYPEAQGYDVNIGGTFWGAPATFFFPFRGRWSENDPELRYVPGLGPGQPGDYLPDRLTDHALALLDQIHDRPFLLSLWFYTVHSPIEAPESLVQRYRAKQPGQHHRDATYAAMVQRMDHNVGRVLERLDRLGLRDQTVVIFTSDNGGVDIPVRSITPTSNYPLRSGKGTLYEGGLRVPLIIRWPGKVREAGVCPQPVCSQDLFATLSDGLGLTLDDTQPQDGLSLLPLLHNSAARLPRDTLYWHYPHYYARMTPASALRHGDWKLVHYYEQDQLELYRLDTDLSEAHNLANAEPEMAAALKQQLDQWRAEVGASAPTVNGG
jgi:arylsulfatase A-like enzyme